MLKIGVLVSGGGTNLQAIIDAIESKKINAEIVSVVSNNSKAYALKRAENHHIKPTILSKKGLSQDEYDALLINHFQSCKVELILLAGFMVVLGNSFIWAFRHKILNIHPSLIPAFCGDGFYGLKVHEAVIKKGVKITGATVHFVNEETDGGEIVLQKAVEVLDDDTPEILQKRVMEEAEQVIFPLAVKYFSEKKLIIKDGKVKLDNSRMEADFT